MNSSRKQLTRLTCFLASLALLGIGLFERANAVVVVTPQDLRKSLREADLVVLGKITSRVRKTYSDEQGNVRLCGTTYSLQIVTTYKGKAQGVLEFSSYANALATVVQEAKVGDEILVLLKHHPQQFDPARLEIPDVVQERKSQSKDRCLSQLSRYSTSDFEEGAFLVEQPSRADRSTGKWVTYMSSRTLIPDCSEAITSIYDQSCRDASCASDPRRRIMWQPLEQKLIEWTRQP